MAMNYFKGWLSDPVFYHYARQVLLLGMPLKKWAAIGNYFQPGERIADLGCGPADILRYLDPARLPAFYLGIDISDRYLSQAARKARDLKLPATFISMDLDQVQDNPDIQSQLFEVLTANHITTVNLFGVLHHIDDLSACATLNLAWRVPTVTSLNTQDVLVIPSNQINNFYVSLDRGRYIRTEKAYDQLIASSSWNHTNKVWTSAGVNPVKYIHYRMNK